MARRGSNPAKETSTLPSYGTVRLIVPVSGPSDVPDSPLDLTALQVMLGSILATKDERVLVTVIDNGSPPDLAAVLEAHADEGWVDRLVSSRVRREPASALESELRSSYEPVVVVARVAVVFRAGWVDGVLAAFSAFPECGMFSLVPDDEQSWHASSSLFTTAWSVRTRLARIRTSDQQRGAERPPSGSGDRADSYAHLAVVRGGTAMGVGFDPTVYAVRGVVMRTLSSRRSHRSDETQALEVRADRAGWWCASATRALARPIVADADDEEQARIRRFAGDPLEGEPGELGRARRAPLSRLVGPAGRGAFVGVVGSARFRRFLTRRAFPELELDQEPGSAFRVTRE